MSPGAKLTVWHRWGHSLSSNKTAVQLSAELDKLLKATRKDDKSIAGGYQTPSLVLADGSEVKFASDDALRAYLQRSAQPLASAERVDTLYRQVLGRGADAGGVKAAQDALAASGTPEGGSLADVRRGLAASPEAAVAVSGLYRTVLGREASAAEVAGFQNTLAQGGSLEGVRGILAHSAEARADIGDLYRGMLGRAADEGGLAGFQDAVARGESLGEVRRDLAASPETTARVGDVYRQVLGRDVDAGSLADARDALARGGSLSEVRASVARSAEGRAAAADLYRRALGREASTGEVAGVQDALASGASLDGVRLSVAASPEASARVSGVFEAVLGRAPEGTGWMRDVLAGGGSVSEVRAGLAYSAEAAGAVRGLYLQTLGRDADAQGVSYWQGRLAGGMSLAEVRAALAAAPEAASQASPAPAPDAGPTSGGATGANTGANTAAGAGGAIPGDVPATSPAAGLLMPAPAASGAEAATAEGALSWLARNGLRTGVGLGTAAAVLVTPWNTRVSTTEAGVQGHPEWGARVERAPGSLSGDVVIYERGSDGQPERDLARLGLDPDGRLVAPEARLGGGVAFGEWDRTSPVRLEPDLEAALAGATGGDVTVAQEPAGPSTPPLQTGYGFEIRDAAESAIVADGQAQGKSQQQIQTELDNHRRQKAAAGTGGTGTGGVQGSTDAVQAVVTPRRVLDPRSIEAWDQAEAMYDSIRADTSDVDRIAKNSGFNKNDVENIKTHMFFDDHKLDDGVRRFDANPSIVNAWSRLKDGDFTSSDIDLLNHELYELNYERLYRTDYRTAHEATIAAGKTWFGDGE